MDLLGNSYCVNGKYDAIVQCSSQQIHSKSHNTTFGNSTVLLKSSTPTSTTASAGVRTLRGDEGFATSCIEGRVSIGYFAPNTSVGEGRENNP